MSKNPFEEFAVEEAIRLKEVGKADEVVAVSIGVKQAQETLRTALAMGADPAILVIAADDAHTNIEPLAVAKILKAIVDGEQPSLVLCGKQSIDNDMNATGQMLSAVHRKKSRKRPETCSLYGANASLTIVPTAPVVLGSGWWSQTDPTEKPDGHRKLHRVRGRQPLELAAAIACPHLGLLASKLGGKASTNPAAPQSDVGYASSRRVAEAGSQMGQNLKTARFGDGIMNLKPVLFAADQSFGPHFRQMLRQGRLRQASHRAQFRDRGRSRGEATQDHQPTAIGQLLQKRSNFSRARFEIGEHVLGGLRHCLALIRLTVS